MTQGAINQVYELRDQIAKTIVFKTAHLRPPWVAGPVWDNPHSALRKAAFDAADEILRALPEESALPRVTSDGECNDPG
jgi:hypothetical protein